MKTKNLFYPIVLLIIVMPLTACGQKSSSIPVTVDPIVELISTVCRLADYDEYNMGSYPAYYKRVGEYFAPFKDHKAVQIAKKIRSENSIGYNAPMSLAVYLKDIHSLNSRVSFSTLPDDLDERWSPKVAQEFLSSLKNFVKDSDFEKFMDLNSDLYRTAVERFRKAVDVDHLADWFSAYMGTQPDIDFKLILGLQNGGANYGATASVPGSRKEIFSILGCWNQDKEGLPVFDSGLIATVVHEFCHSFTNPVVEGNRELLTIPAEDIYNLIGDKMKTMAYSTWEVMMYEYFVRASVIRYMTLSEGVEAGKNQAEQDIKRGFIGVDRFADLLIEYEADRKTYPSFSDFVPQITDFFTSYANVIDQDLAEVKRKTQEKWDKFKNDGPQILKMVPENGAKGVSPNLEAIKIYFDREMNPNGFAVMYGPEEHDMFPEYKGTPSFDETRKIYIMPVKLKSNKAYKFGLNSFKALGFKDTNGLGLYPVVIKFETGT